MHTKIHTNTRHIQIHIYFTTETRETLSLTSFYILYHIVTITRGTQLLVSLPNLFFKSKLPLIELIDFPSFFESLRHDHMTEKMIRNKIRGGLIKMFKGFYRGATARVLLKGRFGREFTYKVGIRQRSRWSPDLGAFYVEDINVFSVIIKLSTSPGNKHPTLSIYY